MRGAGRLVFVEFDEVNKRIFTGSPLGGLWYSEDDGESWKTGGTDYLPEVGVSHIQVVKHSNNGETWFITTGDGEAAFNPCNGVWRTKSKGNTWERISNGLDIGDKFPPFFWSRCRKLLIHPTNPNILFAAFLHGLYRTDNALASNAKEVIWHRVADKELMETYFDIAFVPGSDGEKVLVSGEKLAISNDGGSKGSFTELYNYPSLQKKNKENISIRFAPSSPNVFYGAYKNQLFRYDFHNGEFKKYSVGSKYVRHQALAVCPEDENELFIGNINPVYKSVNGGAGFAPKPNGPYTFHDDQHWICYRQNGEIWLANDGGVFRSKDGGDNWEDRSNGIGAAVYYNLGVSERLPNLLIAGGWDTGANMYNAEEGCFKSFAAFGDAFESVINDSDPENPIYYISIQGGLQRYDNRLDRSTWVGKPYYSIKGNRNWIHKFGKSSIDQSIMYYAGNNGIGRSVDRGDSWKKITPDIAAEFPKRYYADVWVAPSDPNWVYTSRSSLNPGDSSAIKLFVSENALDTFAKRVVWRDISPPEVIVDNIHMAYTISDMDIDEENAEKVWAVSASYNDSVPKVMYYNGESWSDITGEGLEGMIVTTIEHQHGTNDLLYVGTHAGVFYKTVNSSRWTKMHGVPHVRISDMEINQCAGLIRVATYGRGVWEADLINDYRDVMIAVDEVWNESKIVYGPVVIKKGAVLTIDSEINMGINAYFDIEKGGRLILNGATLKNDCQREWKGFRVEGEINPLRSLKNVKEIEVLNQSQILNTNLTD